MKTRTIAITNQKGGVAKTTTTVNLGACLAELGKKVLLLDLDPQGNLSSWFGLEINNIKQTVYELFTGKAEIEDVIIESCVNNLYLAPANISLANVERVFANELEREKILVKKLEPVIDQYDYILMDCPPSLGLVTLNALTTAKEVIIPLETKVLSLNGLITLINTVQLIKKSINQHLEITGIVACKFDKRTNLSRMVVDKIKSGFHNKVFKTIIRESTKLAECPISYKPITQYDPKSTASIDYTNLAKEIIEGEPTLNPALISEPV